MYVWPVQGELERTHSTDKLAYDVTMRDWRTHEGIDIEAAIGSTVSASHAGSVESVVDDDFYGTVVTVNHGDGSCTVYANLAELPAVSVGDWVEPGDVIGAVATILQEGQEAGDGAVGQKNADDNEDACRGQIHQRLDHCLGEVFQGVHDFLFHVSLSLDN